MRLGSARLFLTYWSGPVGCDQVQQKAVTMDQFKRVVTCGIYNFENGKICQEASAADLFVHAFWDPSVSDGAIFEQMICSVRDDLSVICDALETDTDTDAIKRLLMRAQYRIDVAFALRERFAKAEQGGRADLWVVPEGYWAERRVAAPDDLAERGWVRREDALKAIHVMCGEQDTEASNDSDDAPEVTQ